MGPGWPAITQVSDVIEALEGGVGGDVCGGVRALRPRAAITNTTTITIAVVDVIPSLLGIYFDCIGWRHEYSFNAQNAKAVLHGPPAIPVNSVHL